MEEFFSVISSSLSSFCPMFEGFPYIYVSLLQGHLKAPQFTFKKEQFYIDDDQIAKELHKLQSILKDESLTEEQAKAYKGKW